MSPPDKSLSDAEMLNIRQHLLQLKGRGLNQEERGAACGLHQTQVSKIERFEKTGYRIGLDTAVAIARKRGIALDELLHGTRSARGAYEERDEMHAERGKALDVLSRIYEEKFLDAILRKTVPEQATGWDAERWAEEIVAMRKLWRDGHLDLPGLPSPKRHRVSIR